MNQTDKQADRQYKLLLSDHIHMANIGPTIFMQMDDNRSRDVTRKRKNA